LDFSRLNLPRGLSYAVSLKANVFLIRAYISGPDSVETCQVLDTSTGVLKEDEVDDSEHPGSNILVNLNVLMFIINTVYFM